MIDPTVYIAPGAIVLGDVQLAKDVSVWYNSVLRGDTALDFDRRSDQRPGSVDDPRRARPRLSVGGGSRWVTV